MYKRQVEKRVHKNRVWVRRLGKTAAAFLIMGVLFGTINGVSHGGLVEAISGLWQTDESLSLIHISCRGRRRSGGMFGKGSKGGDRAFSYFLPVSRNCYFCQ